MKAVAVGSYQDAAGAPHRVSVREAHGAWQVLDLDPTGRPAVVETLASPDDGRSQAEAIARDYLTTVQGSAWRAGQQAGEPVSEQGGRDADSHRRPRTGPRAQPARGAALPDPAR